LHYFWSWFLFVYPSGLFELTMILELFSAIVVLVLILIMIAMFAWFGWAIGDEIGGLIGLLAGIAIMAITIFDV
jgi:hypothetical protein